MATISEIQQKTIDLIDRLKNITFTHGLGGGGNEYTVLVEMFLYKFLNDKFVFEAKRVRPELKQKDNVWEALNAMGKNEYEQMCDEMRDTIELHKEHLIPYLASIQNEPTLAEQFDSVLLDIARTNEEVFFIQNADQTRIPILKSLSDLVTGGTSKKNEFCKSLIGAVSGFSFEDAFSAGYDFFSTIFEYLIKDYNANGGGTYAEYYTPHSIAMIMAKLLVNPDEPVQSVTCYDPSAGTGTLVIALAHYIGERNCSIYTQDISDKSSTMMMLNLILNGMTHSLSHVIQGNTLAAPFHKEKGKLKRFDYIVSNPPFKLDFSDYRDKLVDDVYKGRFFAGIPKIPNKDKKKMEIYLCFFQHLLYSLSDKGKAAIVVPTGFLTAKSGIAMKIHHYLVDGEHPILRGVVSMPSNIFANTGTNVSVVFIDKNQNTDSPIFIDASKMGETVKIDGNQKTILSPTEVDTIVKAFREKEIIEDFSVAPTFEEIREKGYSLSAGQYFDIKIQYEDITAEEFQRRMNGYRESLVSKFQESRKLEEEIIKQLDNLQFNR